MSLSLSPPQREARLRAAHADRYPGLEPGVWMTAATVAEFVARRGWVGEDDETGRALHPAHFEFRGGPSSALPRVGARERASDPP